MEKHEIPIEQLGNITAYNEQGTAVRLADLWAAHTVVMVFVRHFG